MKVRKAVILAAGYGTRLLPATKSVPKEMLPLVDRPVIQYIVEEAVAAGIEQIIMVTSASKRAIEDFFDRDFELESVLSETGKHELLDAVKHPAEVSMAFVRQKERKGNGHAVTITRDLVGDEPFAIFFPDDVILHDVPAIGQLMDVFDRLGGTVLAVQQVPREQVVQYGVIDPQEIEPRLYRVRSVIEKPSIEEAPSNLTTVGRFVATPELFDVLEETPPGRSGEIWLMDAFDRLIARQDVYACEYQGLRFDCGRPLGLLQASIHLALQREGLGQDLRAHLRSLFRVSAMRTLVIGIPLPHVTFDNYSGISAPAFSEYQRLIVETAAFSNVVEEVVAGAGEHRNFGGQLVHNGPSTADAFSLSGLLEMRRRETEWFLSRGGIAVCFAHPDIAHPGVADCVWRRYSWLPAPPGIRYETHLLPGFGTPGAEVSDADHPFAPFISEFAPGLAYRATIDESAPNFTDYAHVFARSRGGAAIAAELTVDQGRIVMLPPLIDPQLDRGKVAQTLFDCFERWAQRGTQNR